MLSAIKSALPWWAKISAKLVLSRTPMAYRAWQRAGLFRHGHMDTADYALAIFDAHTKRASLDVSMLQGKTILEVGPGDSIASAIIAYAYGAKAILMDAGPFAREDIAVYRPLCELLDSRALRTPDLSMMNTIDDILMACEAEYWTQGLKSWKSINDESVDFIFSQAVLEHIRKHEFVALQQECFRVLKVGSLASHRVDLQDHLGGGLNNLRFSEKTWESDLFAKSGFYTNRIQMNTMLALFEQAGFEFNLIEARRWEKLPIQHTKLNSVYREMNEEELNVSGFDVLLRKKQ